MAQLETHLLQGIGQLDDSQIAVPVKVLHGKTSAMPRASHVGFHPAGPSLRTQAPELTGQIIIAGLLADLADCKAQPPRAQHPVAHVLETNGIRW